MAQIPLDVRAWLLPQFAEGSYLDMRRASVGFSSFPFAFNEESTSVYSTSVKACVFSGIFVSFMLVLVLLRAWIVIKYGSPFVMWSINTLSCSSISLCGVLALGYFPLQIAYSARYVEWERRRPPDVPKTGRAGDLDFAYDPYSLQIPGDIVRMRVAARYLLLAVQWVVKIAFLSIFFEFRHSCKKGHKILLYIISFITVSCITSAMVYIISENVRILKLEKRLGYEHMHPDSGHPLVPTVPEYFLAGMDLFLDLLIVFFTGIILRSLQLNRSEKLRSLIFISPGFITVVIAIARCAILFGMQAPQNQVRKKMLHGGWEAFQKNQANFVLKGDEDWAESYRNRTWILSFLTPVGTYMSVYVACIPAFRVLMRGWNGKNQWRLGRVLEAQDSCFTNVDCENSEIRSLKEQKSWWRLSGRKGKCSSSSGLLRTFSEKASQSYSSSKTSMVKSMGSVHSVGTTSKPVETRTKPNLRSEEKQIPDFELGDFFAGSEADRVLAREKSSGPGGALL